jgi:hypothetical protein
MTLANPTIVASTGISTGYTVRVTSRTTNTFSITRAINTGAVSRTCTRAKIGGCKTNNGAW